MKHQKSNVEIVADYLKQLWRHAEEDIRRGRGESAVSGVPFKVWITVPAIWSEEAQKNVRSAAELAGIVERQSGPATSINLVAEPEAAAFAVLRDFKGRPDVQVCV